MEEKKVILQRIVTVHGDGTIDLLEKRIEENRVVLENLKAVGASMQVLHDVEKQYKDSINLRDAYLALKDTL